MILHAFLFRIKYFTVLITLAWKPRHWFRFQKWIIIHIFFWHGFSFFTWLPEPRLNKRTAKKPMFTSHDEELLHPETLQLCSCSPLSSEKPQHGVYCVYCTLAKPVTWHIRRGESDGFPAHCCGRNWLWPWRKNGSALKAYVWDDTHVSKHRSWSVWSLRPLFFSIMTKTCFARLHNYKCLIHNIKG